MFIVKREFKWIDSDDVFYSERSFPHADKSTAEAWRDKAANKIGTVQDAETQDPWIMLSVTMYKFGHYTTVK